MNQFIKFCAVGGTGFVVDSAVFYLLIEVMPSIILARLIAFWLAATATWLGNRLFTFAHTSAQEPWRQWQKHMLSAHGAGGLNLGLFYLLHDQLGTAVAFCAGIALGLGVNYILARYFVYRPANSSADIGR